MYSCMSQVLLAFSTLRDFAIGDESRTILLPFLHDKMMPFLRHDDIRVRCQVPGTIGTDLLGGTPTHACVFTYTATSPTDARTHAAHLLLAEDPVRRMYYRQSTRIQDVLHELLAFSVAEQNAEVRRAVLSAFGRKYDVYLSQVRCR